MKPILPIIIIVAVIAIAVFTMGGDSKDNTPDNKPDIKPGKSLGKIGYSTMDISNPFFVELSDAIKKKAEEAGYEYHVVTADNDANKQVKQMQDFIAQKYSAIIITAVDQNSVINGVRQANKAGIPVFTADTGIASDSVDVVCAIETDNYLGGRLAGEAMHKALNGVGNVAVLNLPAANSCVAREKGFDDYLKEVKSKIKVVIRKDCLGRQDTGNKVAMDILTLHKDLSGIFCINDPAALGAVAALKKKKRLKDVVVIGFDGAKSGKKAILDGDILADPIQFPKVIGTRTMEIILDYFKGKKPASKKILIKPSLYYKKDALKDDLFKTK
jgi:ribose transport system substrate-binding protein